MVWYETGREHTTNKKKMCSTHQPAVANFSAKPISKVHLSEESKIFEYKLKRKSLERLSSDTDRGPENPNNFRPNQEAFRLNGIHDRLQNSTEMTTNLIETKTNGERLTNIALRPSEMRLQKSASSSNSSLNNNSNNNNNAKHSIEETYTTFSVYMMFVNVAAAAAAA